MQLIDTHTHLFLPEFDADRNNVVQAAVNEGIGKMILPNVDTSTLAPMYEMCNTYPQHCFALTGLHPGAVDSNFEKKLKEIEDSLKNYNNIGIGEIGLDFYWDTTFKAQQLEAFKIQIDWAKTLEMPIAIHVRNSFPEVIDIVTKLKNNRLKGVFHCFTGTIEEAKEIISLGFYLGIGGIVTFKNSGLQQVLQHIAPENILLESDSPYLAPVPYRGKRNESSYVKYTALKISEIYSMSVEEIASITTQNAINLFFDK